jgi:hypothetical protein
VPGGIGGGIGGIGVTVSGWTHAERSKNMKASALPVGDIGFVLHPVGKASSGSEWSPPEPSG